MDAMTGATWAVSQYGAQGPDNLGKVWIAQPLPIGDDRLVFSGHVANPGDGVTVSIRHGGDIVATCLANPGFIVDVPARKGVFHVEIPVRQGDPVGVTGARRSNITVELRRNGRPVDIIPLVGLA